MIRSFGSKATEDIFNSQFSKKLPHNIQRRAKIKLLLIDTASSIDDLKIPPGNRLEQLQGNRAGQWSIRINRQWRVCFEWHQGDAFDVEIIDYH